MKYRPNLVTLSEELMPFDHMLTIVLIRTESLHLSLDQTQLFLCGHFALCLGPDEKLRIHKGKYEAMTFGFDPYFYNVNLNYELIHSPGYIDLCHEHDFPDFRLFFMRNDSYYGVIPLSADGYICLRDYLNRIDRFIKNHNADNMWSCHVRSQLISILYYMESAHLGTDEKEVSAVIRYIREHISSQLNLKQLCLTFRTNRTTLTNQFKELTGMTPMQFVLDERLNQTRSELLFTGLSIGEIALKYGFSDANYYIRAFKRRYGQSPLRYRKECREKRSELQK